jgi:hypothetical protein
VIIIRIKIRGKVNMKESLIYLINKNSHIILYRKILYVLLLHTENSCVKIEKKISRVFYHQKKRGGKYILKKKKPRVLFRENSILIYHFKENGAICSWNHFIYVLFQMISKKVRLVLHGMLNYKQVVEEL